LTRYAAYALPNRSGRPENQWYDVRFEDGVYDRFLGRYLEMDLRRQTERRRPGFCSLTVLVVMQRAR
jgi:hypothetical protein